MTQAYIHETHPVSTRIGAVIVSRVSLLGWGALISSRPATQTITEAGRLWWRFTQSSDLFEVFRDPNFGSGDRMGFGTVAAGLVTLVADNSSGLTSPAAPQQIHVTNGTQGTNPTEDGDGQIIVTFCDEDDLNSLYRDVANELDTGTLQWLGRGTRFEALIGDVQRDVINPMLRQLMNPRLEVNSANVVQLTQISNPQQIKRVAARHCIAEIYERRGAVDPDGLDSARKIRAEAHRALAGITIAIDYGSDGIIDNKQVGGVTRLERA